MKMSFLSDVNKTYIHLSDFALGLGLNKRTQNSIYSSKIASPFKKRNLTPPPTIPRTAPPGVHSRPILISRLLRMRINEIKRRLRETRKWTTANVEKNAPILNNLFLNLTSADCCLAYFKLIFTYLLLILD